jgi:hypothetical protein
MTGSLDGILAYRVDQMEREISALKTTLAEAETARVVDERKRLVAGISFLGGIILALFGVIWAYRGVIFKGTQ